MLPLVCPSWLMLSPLLLASPARNDCVRFSHPPTPDCGSTITVEVGHTVSFTVEAADATCTLPIYLEGAADSPGSTFTPPLPTTGNPVSTTYSWTPGPGNLGDFNLVFHAVSQCCPVDAFCNMTIHVVQTPPCPPCVDAGFGLGAAGSCTVLELGSGQVSMTGPPGGVYGDVCIGPGGRLSMSGSQFITGSVRLAA